MHFKQLTFTNAYNTKPPPHPCDNVPIQQYSAYAECAGEIQSLAPIRRIAAGRYQ